MNLPAIPDGPGPVDRRHQGGLAKRHQGELDRRPARLPLHQPTALSWSGGDGWGRDHAWKRLSDTARARIEDRAGELIEWWAWKDTSTGHDRAGAVMLGERGLSFAEPRLNTEHRPVYEISALELDPKSFRKIEIDHRPPATQGRTEAPPPATASSPPPALPDIGLTAWAKGMLGHLPPKVQTLLQSPFLDGQELLRHDHFYRGSEHRFIFFMYLAGPKHITAVTGKRILPVKHTHVNAHWSLSCRRASVVRRIGI